MDRSFPALFSRSNKDGADIKIDASFEAGGRRYWFTVAEYVTKQQTLDREERAAWREAQKRQVEIRMAELQAEDKKRVDESHIKIQIAQIEVANEQAKIDKELKIKGMDLQAQLIIGFSIKVW